jgi:hypothetical protein
MELEKEEGEDKLNPEEEENLSSLDDDHLISL